MLVDIWYFFFADNPETNTKEKLEIIRPLVALSGDGDDIRIFNFWAGHTGAPEIKQELRN